MSRAARSRVSGFSLIELLVALVIFATMAGIAYSGLSAVTRSHDTLDGRERELAALGRTLALIERDLRAVAMRPGRDGDGRVLPVLNAQAEALEVSSYGRGRAAGNDLGLIERVGYGRDREGLHRFRWPVLDRAQNSRPDRRLLLAQAEQLRWRFLSPAGRWLEQWPPPNPGSALLLPRAVEVVIAHPRLGEIRRLIELPDTAVEAVTP